jgi:hypothetical protein
MNIEPHVSISKVTSAHFSQKEDTAIATITQHHLPQQHCQDYPSMMWMHSHQLQIIAAKTWPPAAAAATTEHVTILPPALAADQGTPHVLLAMVHVCNETPCALHLPPPHYCKVGKCAVHAVEIWAVVALLQASTVQPPPGQQAGRPPVSTLCP